MLMFREDFDRFTNAIAELARLHAKYPTPTGVSGDWIMRDYSLALQFGPEKYLEECQRQRDAILAAIQAHKLPIDKFA